MTLTQVSSTCNAKRAFPDDMYSPPPSRRADLLTQHSSPRRRRLEKESMVDVGSVLPPPDLGPGVNNSIESMMDQLELTPHAIRRRQDSIESQQNSNPSMPSTPSRHALLTRRSSSNGKYKYGLARLKSYLISCKHTCRSSRPKFPSHSTLSK